MSTSVVLEGGIEAKVICASRYVGAPDLWTLQLKYPRFIHSEFMTHRLFSRNASSSRAIPVERMINMVRRQPAHPIHWGKNQPGMQAREESEYADVAYQLWREAAFNAVGVAERLKEYGLHKQVVNRLLEPFQFINVIVTATEWDNFFKLRMHEDAQPEIYELARAIHVAMVSTQPQQLSEGYWHVPYITDEEWEDTGTPLEDLLLASAGRCARVSYMKHDGTSPVLEEDIALAKRLLEAGHMSPFEHQATTCDFTGFGQDGVTHIDREGLVWSGNLCNWIQYRQTCEVMYANNSAD